MPAVALEPQLVNRTSRAPEGDAWMHEIKYDGYRLLASVRRGKVLLYSRSGADWTSKLPWIAKAVQSLGLSDLHLDGELVYLDDDGFPDFESLWSATRADGDQARLYYQVFDVLRLREKDLTPKPLIERKERVVEVLRDGYGEPRLRYVSHVVGNGADFFSAVDALGLEGIVSKRMRSVYQPGVRSSDWLKVKCFHTQQFSVIGFTTETVNGKDVLSSLALASKGQYAGRVEFGVPRRDDRMLRVLRSLGTSAAVIANPPTSSSIQWVDARFVADVRCLRWQPGRHVRHAVLQSVSLSSDVSAYTFVDT